jgi:carboxylesterase
MLGATLHDSGYTVVAPLYPGHGTRVEDMPHSGWRDWVGAATEELFGLHESHPRVHLMGLSMGGLIAVLLAATTELATITTVNAPIRVRSRVIGVARRVGRFRTITRSGSWDPPADEAADFYHQYDDTPLASLHDLHQLMRAAERALPQVHQPALVVQSLRDPTVDPESAEVIYEELGSKRKRIIWLEGDRHVATLDTVRHGLEAALLDHLATHSG